MKMATVKCPRGKRGTPSHEWYDGKKSRIYCCGYIDLRTERYVEECQKCPDHVDKAQDDLERWIAEHGKLKRLIDANALLYEYCQANGCNEVIDEVCPNCFTAGLIASAPTVDAVEVVHGRLGVSYMDEYYGEFANCLECGTDNILPCHYCRNCGAKMDGDGNGN